MIEVCSPVYASWDDYLAQTSYAQRMARCHAASKRANRVHRCQWRRPLPKGRGILDRALKDWMATNVSGPCACCGSLPRTDCSGEVRLQGSDVWSIIERAKGRCTYCGSLAVENRPSHEIRGSPLPWEHVGRRIGSLEHLQSFLDGRINALDNLAWACLWCNVHPSARIAGATDHGGFFPKCIPAESANDLPAF